MARFIPARAGNAFPEQKFHSPTPVHPRTRGERELMIYNQDTGVGSSPHARGTHYLGDTKRLTTRFIPARAGNAVSPLSLRFLLSVHPRTRGERSSRQALETSTYSRSQTTLPMFWLCPLP